MRLSPPLYKEKYSEIVTHTYPIILSCLSGQKKTCTTANTINSKNRIMTINNAV